MTGLGWIGIVRLGLVQAALGAIAALATSALNRIMIVEYALPAALPAGLVGWHYGVQLSRPLWGHRADRGTRRAPTIRLGLMLLLLGMLLAVDVLGVLMTHWWLGLAGEVAAFALIGAGIGAAGTSLLALLASEVAPARRAAAAALTWIMMIAGIIVATAIAGQWLDPFSPQRLALVVASIAIGACALAGLALWGVERAAAQPPSDAASLPFAVAVREMLADRQARHFTGFVFLAMLAYSMQDLILEPFAGLMFGFTPGGSTSLSSIQHMGVLVGMLLAGIGGSAFGGGTAAALRRWIIAGCLGSALALAGLMLAAAQPAGWPLTANVALLGGANGIFAVSAIGAMMSLAGVAGARREGVRMGVWGAAQAIAFAAGGLIGAVGVDLIRASGAPTGIAFAVMFGCEAMLFVAAAALAGRIARRARHPLQEALA